MSTIKVDNIDSKDSTGNITIARPLVATLTTGSINNLNNLLTPANASVTAAKMATTDTLPAWNGSALTNLPAPADNSVTGAKLNISLLAGDTMYASGTDTLAKLAKGTAGQTLTMNSGATAPEWADAAAGGTNGWHLLQSTVLTNQTSVDITGLDNSTYGMFAVVMIGAETGSSAGQFGLRMGDSSGFKTSGYFWGVLRHTCSGTSVDAQNSTSDSYIKMNRLDSQRRSTAVLFVNCEGYHTGSPYGRPTCSGTYVQDDTSSTTGGSIIGGTNENGLDLDRLSVMTSATSFAKGRISFYGIAQS